MTLAAYLVARDMTNAAFAVRIGTSAEAVRRYRQNLRMPDPDVMARIDEATAGDVTANDFHRARREPAPLASAAQFTDAVR